MPNLTTHPASQQPLAYSTNISHLLSPNHKPLLLLEHKRQRNHHHRHHHHHNHHHYCSNNHRSSAITIINTTTTTNDNSNRQIKNRGTRISNSLIQRTTRERESVTSATCTLLQPPTNANKLYWHAASFDESCRVIAEKQQQRDRVAERTRRSDTAKRHVLSRQKPIEQEEDRDKLSSSPLGNRR